MEKRGDINPAYTPDFDRRQKNASDPRSPLSRNPGDRRLADNDVEDELAEQGLMSKLAGKATRPPRVQ